MPVRYTDNDPATIYDEQDGFEAFAERWHTDNDCDMPYEWEADDESIDTRTMTPQQIDAAVEIYAEARCLEAWEYFKKHGND